MFTLKWFPKTICKTTTNDAQALAYFMHSYKEQTELTILTKAIDIGENTIT
jgi:hypothetical protein